MDQPSGNLWQQTSHYYDRSTGYSWNNNLNTGKDSANYHGWWRGGNFRTSIVGGNWDEGDEAGARCVGLNVYPWLVSGVTGLRAVCDSL